MDSIAMSDAQLKKNEDREETLMGKIPFSWAGLFERWLHGTMDIQRGRPRISNKSKRDHREERWCCTANKQTKKKYVSLSRSEYKGNKENQYGENDAAKVCMVLTNFSRSHELLFWDEYV